VRDQDGNVIGYNVPTGRGRSSFHKATPRATGELQPVLDPNTKKPIQGLGIDAAGKVHDWRTAIEKAGELPTGKKDEKGPKKWSFNPQTRQLEAK